MTSSAEHRPDERRKMSVSERDIGTLAADLQGWLAGRLGYPEGLTVSGIRVPGSGAPVRPCPEAGLRPVKGRFLRPQTDSAPSDQPAYPTTG